MPNKILIVEDNVNLGTSLCEYLESKNYLIVWKQTAKDAHESFIHFKPDIVLMDIGLPDETGLALAKKLRLLRKDFVLFFLSAQTEPEIRLEGLELGAHDYITKPFDLRELTLRLDRILASRAQGQSMPDEIFFGDLVFWPKRFEVLAGDKSIMPLTQKEASILTLLITHKNEVVGRDQMLEHIWGDHQFPSNRTIDNYIVRLRKWLESDPKKVASISSIRGIGYKLEIKELL